MPTPLEDQILDDFETRLAASHTIPDGLIVELMRHVRGDRSPAADVLLEAIKANVGDQSV